jgi:hypothetical protein
MDRECIECRLLEYGLLIRSEGDGHDRTGWVVLRSLPTAINTAIDILLDACLDQLVNHALSLSYFVLQYSSFAAGCLKRINAQKWHSSGDFLISLKERGD